MLETALSLTQRTRRVDLRPPPTAAFASGARLSDPESDEVTLMWRLSTVDAPPPRASQKSRRQTLV